MNESILIIEDDPDMAQVLAEGLQEEAYRVSVANNGGKGLELASTGDYAAILLDIMLPIMDGYTIARQLRSDGNTTPILMLTALDATGDIVTGLDAGAEDYLSKPFSFLELLARLRALLRRGKPQPVTVRVSDLAMNTASRTVTRNGALITLTKTEYTLLEILMRNAGHVVSREEIVKVVWNSRTSIEQNSIDVFVRSLRVKIDHDAGHKLIHTVRGFGYKLAAT